MKEKVFLDEMKFAEYAAFENDKELVAREGQLYTRGTDPRTEFARDYTRILHCQAYRRLKHKTQVFFNEAGNDHICTRIEHVAHVESVSGTIAQVLGLNQDLTRAIAIGHDIGHAPFGHRGEKIIDELVKQYITGNPVEAARDFWHEKNGVYIADNLELLENPDGKYQNMQLTYAVRDGIISHCGEIDENCIRPREKRMSLDEFDVVGKFQAATWEGCVVKVSDKIAYLGRDIQDAMMLGFLNENDMRELSLRIYNKPDVRINTTTIIQEMIGDICRCSTPDSGLCMSEEKALMLKKIKEFNYEKIYFSRRHNAFNRYATLMLSELFMALAELYRGEDTINYIDSIKFDNKSFIKVFDEFLAKYCNPIDTWPEWAKDIASYHSNKKIYGFLTDKKTYYQAVIDFIAGMTDVYAMKAFEELL